MTDSKQEVVNISKKSDAAIVALCLLFAYSVVMTIAYISINKTYTKQEKELNKVIVTQTINLSQNEKKFNECSQNMEILEKRLEGISTNEDLLKRDIVTYIDKRYSSVPKTLAAEISNKIVETAKSEDVSPQLLVGIIEVESQFNPMVVSSKKARGLMQVMPEWVEKLGLKDGSDLHDIDTGINSGVKVLKIHINESNGSITKGLYYYSGKSKEYAAKVYESVGRFVSFRSTINGSDSEEIEQSNGVNSNEQVSKN